MQLELKQLKIDGGTQPRVAIDEEIVAEYAEALREGASFPPVVAFHEGDCWWLADGFHRYHAHQRAGLEKIEADVREGTLREAILFSVGANTGHGLRRTNEDKHKAVITMLTNELVAKDPKGNSWSDRAVARQCGVDHAFVGKVRASLAEKAADGDPGDGSPSGDGHQIEPARRAVKRGKQTYVQDTSKIRRANKKRRKPAGISPDALTPVLPHSHHFARTAMELPHDPEHGARAIVSVMGAEYARSLVTSLTSYLEGLNS